MIGPASWWSLCNDKTLLIKSIKESVEIGTKFPVAQQR